MNRRCHTLLAPLLAVLAFLLGLAGSAAAAFNAAATDPHYGNFLLHTEAPARMPLEIADPDREIGVWLYDSTLGVPVYVRQNPWTSFDPEGLASVEETLKDGKISVKEARELEFKKGEAEAILDANKIKKVTSDSVRKDIVGNGMFTGTEYVKDNMVWPNEDTQYVKNWKSGMSIDEVVVTETARRNHSLAKQAIVRQFKDEQAKKILKVAEVMSYSIMEGSQFVIPTGGGFIAKLGTRMAAGAPRVFTAAASTVNISAHGLRHVPEEIHGSLSRAVQQDLAGRGFPAMGKSVQRSLQLNGKTYSYRAYGLNDGSTNVGTLLEGTYTRNIALPQK